MGGREGAQRAWRRFCKRQEEAWTDIQERHPGFVPDLMEVLAYIKRQQWTTEGAVVREFPRHTEVTTQTRSSTTRDTASQVESVSGQDVETQTPQAEAKAVEEPRPYAAQFKYPGPGVGGSRAQSGGVMTPLTDRCWNCRTGIHPYSRCPEPRNQSFCYGCGEPGVTLAGCRRCSFAYRRIPPGLGIRGPRNRGERASPPPGEGWPWEEKTRR